MKKVFKIAIFSLVTTLLVSSPLIGFGIAGTSRHVYQYTYFGALSDKFERLKNDKKKKIILIGGSNVAFGFNSKLIEEEFPEYSVHNFGLYAALGTKVMMDLAKVNIGEGDMVFIIPEINEQSMSLYFSGDAMLKALDSNWSMYDYLDEENKKNVNSAFFNFTLEKSKYNKPIAKDGIYQRINFNKYGDIEYLKRDQTNKIILDENDSPISFRTQNIMPLRYDPSMIISFSQTKVDDEFITYLNNFSEFVRLKNANLYFEWPPINKKCFVDSQTQTIDFYWSLRSKMCLNVVGNPINYIFEPNYFYDSNFHLNDNGSILRTYVFIQDIYREIFDSTKKPKFEIPTKPDFPLFDINDIPNSENSNLFNYKEVDNGLEILSAKPELMNLKKINLPIAYNHKPIIGINEFAFENCKKLESLYIPAGYYRYFKNQCFDNTLKLKEIFLEQPNPSAINVDYTGNLLKNINNNLKIYVPEQSLSSYQTDYYWGAYSSFLRGYNYEI